ncbi:MAG: ATP-binding protein [Halobacteriaceae archaeon]
MYVLGRDTDQGQVAELGVHRATDGSSAAPVAVDLEHPHAALVVGKRGSGKSHTLAVIAEGIAAADGVSGVVVDPMGGLDTLAALDGVTVEAPVVAAGALPPRAWCGILDLDPADPVGALVWRAAGEAATLAEMQSLVEDSTAEAATRRAARNHLEAARSWDVFGPNGLTATDLMTDAVTVIDCSTIATQAANAVVRAVVDDLYRTAIEADGGPLPWVFVDEAHAFFDGVAGPGIDRLLTRGRHPGVSVVLATQRPAALPGVAISQADLLVAHRLTSTADLEALDAARPTYLRESLLNRRPAETGEAIVVDDATEVARAIRVRDRSTPDGGASPCASKRAATPTD